jgi:hypothetical protein
MAITGSTISALSSQMPGQNQKLTTGLQEAAKTQMRQQMAGQGPMGVQQVQAMGQQAAAQAGQANLQVQQQGAQAAQKLGGLALTQEQQDKQRQLQSRQLTLAKQSRLNEQTLQGLDANLKNRLVDDQFQFQKDELGRTMFNDRQLMDYKIQTAKSDLEMRDFEDKMRQTSQRRIQILKAAQAKVEQELQQQFALGQQKLDQALSAKLAKAKRDLEEKIKRERAAQANRASMFSAGGAILGAAAGIAITVATGGAGAAVLAQGGMMGAGFGQGVGGILSGIPEARFKL